MSVLSLGKINGQEFKAIVTIPGWQADKIWERGDADSPAELAKIYAASVWAYACITIRADAIAAIEWEIVPERDQESPLNDRNPLVRLLKEVNPELNWDILIRAAETDLDIFGRAYWLKERPNRGGVPRGLFRLNPQTVELIADETGIQGFKQQLGKGQPRVFKREDVIYFREYHPTNDLGGLSKLSVAMAAASAGINTAEYTAAFFKNYAIPPLVFSSDQPIELSAVEKMRDTWNRWFRGKKQQHKTGWTTHGMKPNIIGYPTKDLAMKDLMEEIRRDICAVFRVPPSLAGAWEAANYATADTQLKFLYNVVFKPRCKYIGGVLQAELFNEFQPGLEMKWRFDKLEVMAEDKKEEAERHAILVNALIEDPVAAAEDLEVEPALHISQQQEQPRQAPLMGGNGRGNLIQEEMRVWERFAKNRIKAGQPLREFETHHIPLTLKKSIEGQLEAAGSVQDVTEIMRAAQAWKGYP